MRAWTLPIGMPLLVGTLGCGDKSESVAKPGRDAAVAAIEKLGGRVYLYDRKSREGPMENVNLSETAVTDADLAHLKGLTSRLELNLRGTQVTDAGLEHVKGLTNLVELNVSGTQVTDAGVNELKKTLPNCQKGYDPFH